MSLATIVHVITQLELGGAQQNTLDTCARLDRSRYRVALLAGDGGALDSVAARIEGLDFRLLRELVRPVSPRRDRRALREIALHLKEIRSRTPGKLLVHTHSSKAGILGRIAARLARADAIVHTIHGFGHPAFRNPLLRAAAIAAEKHLAPRTDAFIAVSRANVAEGDRLGLFRKSRVELIRSGFDLDEFRLEGVTRAQARERLGLPQGAAIAGSVACLKPQKAPLDFAEVAARVVKRRSDALFLLAGDGELRAPLERRLRELGVEDRVLLLGWREDVPWILRALDVFLLTSRWEGLPRVVVQAMASGVPVVANAVDGVKDVVEDGVTGFAIAPGDVGGAANRVLQLLSDPGMAARIAARAQDVLPEFDVATMVARIAALYDELLGREVR